MYTQQDQIQNKNRIIKYCVIMGVVLIGMLVLYGIGIKNRWEMVVMTQGCAMFAWVLFMWLLFIWPCVKYSFFLKDLTQGIGREVTGSIVEVSGNEEMQDGVRVLPVRIFLESEQDERIVYLNATKTENFPKPGTMVQLGCFGRHIKQVTVL